MSEERPTAGDFPGSDRVVTIPSTTSIVDAFEILVKNKILAAPVYDATAKKYTGFFDVMDFLVFVTEVLEKQESGTVQSPFEFCDLRELLTTVSVINPRALDSVCNCSTADPFHPVLPTASLDELMELLGLKGMHRVPVVDPKTGLVTKIISQSSITKFLYKHAEPIKFLKRVSLFEANIMTKDVVSVKEDDPVLLAFQRMRDNKLSGIAVLDDKGKLLSTISSSDLRAVVSGKSFQFSGCTVMDFLAKSRALDGPNSRPAVVTVHPDTGMYDIVGRLSATGLHRVFVSSSDHDLLGVISLKDILKFLLLKSKD